MGSMKRRSEHMQSRDEPITNSVTDTVVFVVVVLNTHHYNLTSLTNTLLLLGEHHPQSRLLVDR